MAMIHLYFGDGKGKSTAAAGLAIRMAGRGGKAVMARFLKSDDSGEVPVLTGVKGIEVLPCGKSFGFSWDMTPEVRLEAAEYYARMFREACRKAEAAAEDGEEEEGPRALLILDEICAAVNGGFIRESDLLEFLDRRPEGLEVVLTGRNPSEELLLRADYATEMKEIKHPYQTGIPARKGIEY